MKKIAVLGSTGSIGTQTLDVVKNNADKLQICSLVAYSNQKLLAQQAEEFLPDFCGLIARDGEDCLIQAVKNCDIAVIATKGITALTCLLYCLDNGIPVALANKEAIVCGGSLVTNHPNKQLIAPVDSEHCAINQCLQGMPKGSVDKILLTASGGPFWDVRLDQLQKVTAVDALKHPNWNMGSKITVDSATMMNKALEVIEASRLFDVPVDKIEIVVHRQSVVHSMVQYTNGSVLAQLANADMRLPIQVALLGAKGKQAVKGLDFDQMLALTFEPCNFEKFPCAGFGYKMAQYPELCTTVMNGANDVCVDNFLQGKLCFTQFYNIILHTIEHFAPIVATEEVGLQNIVKYDGLSKRYAQKLIDGVL